MEYRFIEVPNQRGSNILLAFALAVLMAVAIVVGFMFFMQDTTEVRVMVPTQDTLSREELVTTVAQLVATPLPTETPEPEPTATDTPDPMSGYPICDAVKTTTPLLCNPYRAEVKTPVPIPVCVNDMYGLYTSKPCLLLPWLREVTPFG